MLRILAFLFLLCAPALAADNNFPTPGGSTVQGTLPMCLNASGQAIACTASGAIGPVQKAYTPTGYCQLTSMAAATQVSSCAGGIPAQTVIAEICVEAQAVRYRDDGVAPTASVGIPVPAGTCFAYAGTLATLQFIQQTAGAIVNVSFYR